MDDETADDFTFKQQITGSARPSLKGTAGKPAGGELQDEPFAAAGYEEKK